MSRNSPATEQQKQPSEAEKFRAKQLATAEKMIEKIKESIGTYKPPFYAAFFSGTTKKNAELLGHIKMFCTTTHKDAYSKLRSIKTLLIDHKDSASHLISHLKKDGITTESVELAASQYIYTPSSSPGETDLQIETPPSRSDNETPKI